MDDVPSGEPRCAVLTKACKYLRLYGKGYKTIFKLWPTVVTEVLKTDKPSVKREYNRKRIEEYVVHTKSAPLEE